MILSLFLKMRWIIFCDIIKIDNTKCDLFLCWCATVNWNKKANKLAKLLNFSETNVIWFFQIYLISVRCFFYLYFSICYSFSFFLSFFLSSFLSFFQCFTFKPPYFIDLVASDAFKAYLGVQSQDYEDLMWESTAMYKYPLLTSILLQTWCLTFCRDRANHMVFDLM